MSCPLFRMISGATYSGVPQNVHVFRPKPMVFAKPKSVCRKREKKYLYSSLTRSKTKQEQTRKKNKIRNVFTSLSPTNTKPEVRRKLRRNSGFVRTNQYTRLLANYTPDNLSLFRARGKCIVNLPLRYKQFEIYSLNIVAHPLALSCSTFSWQPAAMTFAN